MGRNLKATQTSNSDLWETPVWLFDLLHEEFDFTIDLAASPENAKLPVFYDKQIDGLTQKWRGVCFLNPPYSKIKLWMQKAHQTALDGSATVVCLIPARSDTQFWWNHVRHGEVRFLPGRLRFIGAEGGSAPFPSAVVIFRKDMNERTPTTLYWDVHDPDKRRRKAKGE